MNTALTPTISILELLWTLVAFGGVVIHTISAYETRGDVLALRRSRKNGVSLLMAKDCFRTELIEGSVQAVFFAVGLRAMMIPASPTSAVSQFLVAAFFLGAEAALIANSVLRRHTRVRVIDMLEDGHR